MHLRVRIGASFICAVLASLCPANLEAPSASCIQPSASHGDDMSMLQTSMGRTSSGSLRSNSDDMNPMEFLIISSPSLKKIVWARLSDFVANKYKPYALITNGLKKPMGVAFDPKRGYLYVADAGEPAIYRYTVSLNVAGAAPSLITNGVRIAIQLGYPVEWLAVDDSGNLFYTSPKTNNINKIGADVMKDVNNGALQAEMLNITSEKTLEIKSTRLAASNANRTNNSLPTNAPPTKPEILSVYEAKYNPNVSAPAGIWIDGPDLYWTNTKNGTKAGTIVKGEVDPAPFNYSNTTGGPLPFPAEAITHASPGAFDMAKFGTIYYFSQNGTTGTGLVSALLSSTGDVMDIIFSLRSPRGLAWDGKETMYVADEDAGNVWSFPAGRFMANPPLTLAVKMDGAYGIKILRRDAPCFQNNVVSYDTWETKLQ